MENKHNHHTKQNHQHADKGGHQNQHRSHNHHDHHAQMIQEFKKRFWVSLIITLPIVVLAPMIQELLGYQLRFNGDRNVQFILSTIIFFYGGWPFLKGLADEIKQKTPGMMTLIALAISVAYFYSSAVVFGFEGKIFFWELASLIVIMLLGHWIEMKSVMGASNALQELAKMMPSTARRIKQNGDHEDIPVEDLQSNDIILVKPGESVENSSEHPIAGGIVRKAKTEGLEFDEAQNFQNITGKGIKATLEGQEIKIVSPGMLKEQNIESPSDAFKSEDETVVFVLIEDKLAGFIALAYEIIVAINAQLLKKQIKK